MRAGIVIRREPPARAAAVRKVHTEAFGRPDEADLVKRLRRRARFYLGLVAVDGKQIVGHILFTRVTLHCGHPPEPILALAPMAVRPRWQRQGIGSALVREGLAACYTAGHDVVAVVGHPDFYPRFGFVRASPLGLMSEPTFPDEVFMVTELTPGALRGRHGVVVYGEDFGAAR